MDKTEVTDKRIIEFIDGCSVLVVIVSYKTDKLVLDALKSLEPELSVLPHMQVVIVDNTCGEDAESIELAIIDNGWQDWVRVKVSDRNGGFSYGNNQAISPALAAKQSPDYIWLLNPDTVIYNAAGTALVNFLEENNDVGVAGSCLINHDGSEWATAFRFPSIISELEQALSFGPFSRLVKNHIAAKKMGDQAEQVDWLPGASMMIRTKVFDSAELFDEGYFLYYEETDFCLNARINGWTSWYIPSSKVMHISGQSTGATGESALSKRLPQYMFESRSRYFIKNHGILYATIADIAKISGLICNKLMLFLRGSSKKHRPHLLRDSVRNLTIFKYITKVIEK